jgi:hypothetical protein
MSIQKSLQPQTISCNICAFIQYFLWQLGLAKFLTILLDENPRKRGITRSKMARIKGKSASVLTTLALSSGDVQPQRLSGLDTTRLLHRGQGGIRLDSFGEKAPATEFGAERRA